MPLSVNNPIFANDIDHITMFKALKVWLLTGPNDDKVVIKSDAIQQVQYKSASPIVKAIAPGAKLKILIAPEIAALKQFIADYEQIAQAYQALGMAYRPDEAQAISDLKLSLTFGFPFVKMEAVDVKDLKEALNNRLGPNADKTDLRNFTTTLNAPGGLERLGQIIAVDLFNGNKDRFYPGAAGTELIGGVNFNFRCLVNVGNVFRVATVGGSDVGALDFIDPQSVFKDINTPLSQAEATAGTPWPGRVLADKKQRNEFAKDVVHDLESVLSPRKSAFSLKTKLKGDAASRLANGMVEGAQRIKSKLEVKYNPGRWTPGITDRYMVMCQVQ
jgi:hypothetical protein